MLRYQRYILPIMAVLLVVVIGVTLATFGHPPSHRLAADEPTATVPPTDTATPTPTATPAPTDTPQPTSTPTPTPGELAIQGTNPTYRTCPDNPTGDPALDNWGERDVQVTNTGGRLVYWTVTSTEPLNIVALTTGTVEPGGTGIIRTMYFDVALTVHITWSDHVSASGSLTAGMLCYPRNP